MEGAEDDYEEERYEEDVQDYNEPMPNDEPDVSYVDNIEPIIIKNDVPKKDEKAFTQKMNINMPQKPTGNMSEHPKEVQEIIKEGRKAEEKAKMESKKPKKTRKKSNNESKDEV